MIECAAYHYLPIFLARVFIPFPSLLSDFFCFACFTAYRRRMGTRGEPV